MTVTETRMSFLARLSVGFLKPVFSGSGGYFDNMIEKHFTGIFPC